MKTRSLRKLVKTGFVTLFGITLSVTAHCRFSPTDGDPAALLFTFLAGPTKPTLFAHRYQTGNSPATFLLEPYEINSVTGTLTVGSSSVSLPDNSRGGCMHPLAKVHYRVSLQDNVVRAFRLIPPQTIAEFGSYATGILPADCTLTSDGKFMYVANSYSGTISMYQVNSDGSLVSIGTVTAGQFGAPPGIAVHPSNKFLYYSSAGATPSAVLAYTINPQTGALTANGSYTIAGGGGGYGMRVTPTEKFLYVADRIGGLVHVVAINTTTGALSASSTIASVVAPQALDIDPVGAVLFVGNSDTTLRCFFMNPTTGVLTATGSSISNPTQPYGVRALKVRGITYIYVSGAGYIRVFKSTSCGAGPDGLFGLMQTVTLPATDVPATDLSYVL